MMSMYVIDIIEVLLLFICLFVYLYIFCRVHVMHFDFGEG